MTVIDALRHALTSGDPTAAASLFAEDAVLHSPAVISVDYTGREQVGRIAGFSAQVLGDIRFTDELHSADQGTHALIFEGTVAEQPAQGVLYLATRDDRIAEITLLLRPLRAVEAFVQAMGTRGAQPAVDFAAGIQ